MNSRNGGDYNLDIGNTEMGGDRAEYGPGQVSDLPERFLGKQILFAGATRRPRHRQYASARNHKYV